MKARCFNKKNKEYNNYGGRGITICDEWKNDFLSFFNWSMSNGHKDGLSIDRIDVNGNYCPENCRWITPFKQGENKRNHHYIEYNGEKHYLAEWERILKIKKGMLYQYLKHNSFDKIYKKYSN